MIAIRNLFWGFVLTCIFQVTLFAQSRSLQIRLQEANQQAVLGATLQLTDRADTTRKLYALSDTAGKAVFSIAAGHSYRLVVTSVGYKPIRREPLPGVGQAAVTLIMTPDNVQLQAVSVTAAKALVRQEDDKTIVDPEPIAATSTSAYELLEKTPGLFLDPDGNVYLSSTTPATIYINGREQKMSAADIASILKSLPPNSIARMEILRTPSARYDASSSGGIVNIVLKKGISLGLTGSVNAGFNQGRFGNQFVGLNLNNSQGKRSSYLNLNYTRRNLYEQVQTNRAFAPDSILRQDAYTTYPAQVFYAGYGLGFELSKKWDLNLDGRFSWNESSSSASNSNQISQISTNRLASDNLNLTDGSNRMLSISQGLNTKYKIDTLGSELITDVSYNFTGNRGDQVFSTQYLQPEGATTFGDGNFDSQRHLITAQSDLKYKLSKSITLETGVKSTWQNFTSQQNYFSLINTQRLPNTARTNAFEYRENINSGYAQVSKTFGLFMLKGGLRLENTNMDGHQRIPTDTSFKINRTDLFPYVYLSRRVAKIAGYELRSYLVYRRSITRPAYDYLNPAARYVDQYLYDRGNPALRPQFTENYEVNISVEDRPLFAIGQNNTRDIFTNVVYQDPTNRSLAYRTYDNLGTNKETYFRLLAGIPPIKRYFFVFGAQYNHNQYSGVYENKPLNFSRGSWSFFTYHSLKIDPRSTVTLNGFIRTRGQLQFYELSNFGGLNLSLNRKFMDNKLLVTFTANDIFFTNFYEFTLQQGSVSATGLRRNDTRRFGMTLRYNFGVRKKEERVNMFNVDAQPQ
ncbi:outer membrane beta-barrel protein [Spirosoma foliorum]|uniref:Outer membrane beta-barrel protein n=1 Tax=Spirosoma foliorum TaxID=2710596 RepID=A0A7G5H5U8_9BACT|nr:outer membrane beta-barrel protein [Spirosoma foliorum]QMW06490.1 outer membrane beta-barrel protein [Spirosoma foliorum]